MPKPTTAEKILRAAHGIMDREGAEAVSMRRVAEAVGITPMAIYRHFPNRDALLKRICDDSFASVAKEWEKHSRHPDPYRGLQKAMDRYLDYAQTHPNLFDHAFTAQREGARRFPEDFRERQSPTLTVIADLLAAGMQQRQFREADPWDVAMMLWGVGHGLIALYRAGRFSYDEKQFRAFYRQSLETVFDGIKR